MAKIVNYERDLSILNRELARIQIHDAKLLELERTIRKLEEQLKKLITP